MTGMGEIASSRVDEKKTVSSESFHSGVNEWFSSYGR